MNGCCWLVTALFCWLGTVQGQQDDSLQGALEAISRRQRDLADDDYYVDRGIAHFLGHPEEEMQYYGNRDGFPEDGQPEDIGYGYQKSVSPHTPGIFEPVALPSANLGSHDNFANGRVIHFSKKELEGLASDYSGNNANNNHFAYKFPSNAISASAKRSIFRERDDGNIPESLQHLYSKHESGLDADSGRPILMPSSFRERYPGRTGLPPNALALVRSFGGLDRDSETGTGDDDSDEYLTILNSIWEKYKNSAPEGFDPEELTETDIEELLNYFGDKEDRKRYDSYVDGYDFYNSPLSWNKRSKQKLDNTQNDGFFHALKFLSGDRDVLESLRDDDFPTEENDEDVAKVLMEQKPSLAAQYGRNGYREGSRNRKRMWHDAALVDRYPYQQRISKRFPVTKRSPNFIGREHSKSIKSFSDIKQRQKKNVGDGEIVTDPKVAQEINNIFSTSGSGEKDKTKPTINESDTHEDEQINKTKSQVNTHSTTEHEKSNTTELGGNNEHPHYMHRRDKETGQKEESDDSSFSKPVDVKKKSIDWSDYFGIDRRRKKSLNKNINDEWLLNQYLKAYSLSNNGSPYPDDVNQLNRGHQYESSMSPDSDYDLEKKGPDDIDDKLRAMEDLIVDEALKYTGAHEGITDSKEIQKVKDRVMSKLAAAYSLEKMRRALGEFKSSIAAQNEAKASIISTPKPEEKEDQKSKRVAVKKEKAELEMKDKKMEKKSQEENDLNYSPTKPGNSIGSNNFQQQNQGDEVCPVLEDVAGRCRQISIIAGDRGDLFLPLCTLHQICYLCGPELGTAYPGSCDISFLTEANNICHDNAQCRFAARRMLAGMRALKGDPSPAGCDWGNNPCLARFLALATDRYCNLYYVGKQIIPEDLFLLVIMENTSFTNGVTVLDTVPSQHNVPTYITDSVSSQDINNDLEMATYSERTIVSVQPQRDGGVQMRHPVPFNNGQWQTLDVRQLNPQWGLQLLVDREQILIHQTVELDQLLATVESENRYVIKVPDGMTIFFGAEYSSVWQRLCCGSSRAFTLHLLDPTKQEALMLVRRLAGTVGCYVQKIEVYIPSGIYIGCVKQQPTLMVPNFVIQNASGNILFTIEGPRCCACSMFTEASFQIKSSADGNQLASISHSWQDRTGSYGLLVTFPARNADPRTKALIMAAAFLFEYMFFESAKSSHSCRCFKRS
ncbi:uncharacterized protein LOC142317765 [Lycorma delicatula]|uniref:uncharacterized protein LOC142317765 n=1 Tax=Lycorma delicatula TaxID=130591 RepID=UPI003F5141AD